MVRIENPDDYILKDIVIAQDGKHKYVGILEHKTTNKIMRVPFGDRNYEQYHDKLGVYSNLDHHDKKRQENFLRRHAKNIEHKYSSGWFSKVCLWTWKNWFCNSFKDD